MRRKIEAVDLELAAEFEAVLLDFLKKISSNNSLYALKAGRSRAAKWMFSPHYEHSTFV